MNVAVILVLTLVYLVIAYFTYGRRVGRKLGVDPSRPTPAETLRDDIDYVPTKWPVLLGHHFASIAGAAPIIGPIVAGAFGWGVALAWILLGVVFMGAVHDFSSLLASVRHEGKSIGTIIERNMGLVGKRLFLLFSWSALILVVAVFTNAVAKTFVATPAVATASLLFLALAILFGFGVYRRKAPLSVATLVGVLLLAACIALGVKYPILINQPAQAAVKLGPDETAVLAKLQLAKPALFDGRAEAALKALPQGSPDRDVLERLTARARWVKPIVLRVGSVKAIVFWKYVLLVYIFFAATAPVWLLLQPRDYLNSFLLYAMLLGAVVGALIVRTPVQPGAAFISLWPEKLGPIFPLLFVTIACGSISGFHSLVASGTTAKQLDSESHCQVIGYGAMLIEGLLAVVAVCTIAVFTKQGYFQQMGKLGHIGIFSRGVGGFLEGLGVPLHYGVTFTALAVSAFALTSLDTATRLSRFAFQEFFQVEGQERTNLLGRNRYIGTAVSVVCGGALALTGGTAAIWPIFGSANQLLAALALLTVAVWLARLGRDNRFVLVPMWIMFAVTITALALLAQKRFRHALALLKQHQSAAGDFVLAVVAVLLLVLGVVLLVQALKKLRALRGEADAAAAGAAE